MTASVLQNLSITIIITLLFICFQSTSSQIIDNVVSCSGFVRLSPEFGSQYKPNLSEIKIIAKTVSGIVKETVECSPHGFYLLPIYDIGTYKLELQGPAGWSFEPNSASISIENSSCNDGNDINFLITGFSIYGSVNTDEAEEKGIAGVEIHLKDNTGAELKVVTSSEDGSYTFSNVKPGNYILNPTHPTWTLSDNQIAIQVPYGNLNVDKNVVVKGYDLFGSVLSVGGEPMPDVDFTLVKNGETIKKLTSKSDGKFHFFEIPCGSYELQASYLSDTTTFEVSPQQISVNICRKSVGITNPFRIVGFSVVGKVVNKEQGLEGVSIFVNGVEKTSTDKNGVYKWEKANEGTYSISASKDHYQFSSLNNIQISPSNYHIPDIKVEKYHICGKLFVEPSFPSYLKVREVNVKNVENSKTYNVKTTPEGDFCLFTEPGQFIISPIQSEESKGLLFSPNEKQVTVSNSPILNQDFHQSKVSISGSIKPKIDFHSGNIEIKLVDLNTKQVRQSTYVDENSEFNFPGVFPGNYQVEVDYKQWCWQSTSIPLLVKTEEVKNLQFERVGHKFAFVLNADVDLVFENVANELGLNKLYPKGKHEICLPNQAGTEYKITPKSCFKFEKDSYVFNVKNNAYPEPLKISFTHIEVTGSVLTAQADSSLSVSVKSNNNAINPTVKLVSSNNNVFEYGYSFWANPGDSLVITPSSNTLLFYPRSTKVNVHTQEKCVDKLPNFDGRTGKYFEGKIEPPMSGVKVVVYSKDTREVISTVVSTEAGSYVAGPLYDDIQYELTASLEGYNFVRSGDNFEAIELAKLTISVVDNEGNIINGAVLLSLTSDEGFRRNNITDIESGKFTFEDLFPGNYYLKPLLKEYNFNPSNMEIEVIAGSEIKKTITAIRVAYSCFGSVRSLNLLPEKLLTIQAKSVDGSEVEETQSDENGNFRIRGLKPTKEYQVTVKSGAKVDRSSPSQYQFVVPTGDVRDINFTIFKKFNRYELTGAVIVNNPDWISTVHVQLFSEKEGTLVRSLRLGPSNVFNFPLLPKDEYFIRLNTTLSSKLYSYKIEDIPVVFENDSAFVEILFNADFHVYDAEIAQTPFYYLIVIVLGIVLYIYRRPVKELIQKFQSGKWNEEEITTAPAKSNKRSHK